MPTMKLKTPNLHRVPIAAWPVLAAITLAIGLATAVAVRADDKAVPAKDSAKAAAKPALTVTVTTPQRATLPLSVSASGSIAAWQEAVIGAEANGLRLATVRVNVGDRVKRGQVLATFAADVPQAELAQSKAAVAEAEATLAEAAANAQRARDLQASGALSAQQINQYMTAERTAAARLEAQRALARTQQIRLSQTNVLAPDDGVISARVATVGAVVGAGQELFRMVRQGRLEWRAEVPASDLARVAPGQPAKVVLASGDAITGRVRIVAPTVDAATRNGLVYVDLPSTGPAAAAKAGMFARGEFQIGSSAAWTLPQTAVLLRDGFSYAYVVGADSKVQQIKLDVGRRLADRIEITGGLKEGARVVATGAGFLGDGDTVKVVDAAPAIAPPTAVAPAAPTTTTTAKK